MANGLAGMINQETLNGAPAESPDPIAGTGGGLADMVPAQQGDGQPAALSEGEFVWPADVVSMLGDGSTEAGARILHKLMEEIRAAKAKSGKKQSKSISELLG